MICHSCSLRSVLELVVVDPLGLCGKDTSVGDSVLKVRFHLKELVSGAELASVVCAAIANHYLRGVLIWHDNGRLGEAGAEGPRVIGLEGLLDHACVEVISLLVDSPIKLYGQCINTYFDQDSVSEERLTLP